MVLMFSLMSCTKKKDVPVVVTSGITDITGSSASSGGTITSEGGGEVLSRGVCWSTNNNPTIADDTTIDGSGTGSFISMMTGLTGGTVYYARAYASNNSGTGYGNSVSFTTLLVDIDNNIYRKVKIGNQIWMAENLKTTRYNEGTEIPDITDNAAWSVLLTGAYSDYGNNPSNSDTYGRLYNWYAIAFTNIRNVCPAGWHVPTDFDWGTLVNYLSVALGTGGMLKETGTAHWIVADQTATNETGFTALPGGLRDHGGTFLDLGYSGSWWSASQYVDSTAYGLTINQAIQSVTYRKNDGLSVRCVKD